MPDSARLPREDALGTRVAIGSASRREQGEVVATRSIMVQHDHPHHEAIVGVLSRIVSPTTAASICGTAHRQVGPGLPNGQKSSDAAFVGAVSRKLAVFCNDTRTVEECLREIRRILASPPQRISVEPVVVVVLSEDNIVAARQAARTMAGKLGFHETDQAKITTAVSELARNIHRYANAGTIALSPLPSPSVGIQVVAKDYGPGIPDISKILAGNYRSKTGMGLGILGCKRLADEFAIDTSPQSGTEVRLTKYLRKAA